MKKTEVRRLIHESAGEIEEIIMGSYNSEQPIGFGEVIRVRELIKRITETAVNARGLCCRSGD